METFQLNGTYKVTIDYEIKPVQQALSTIAVYITDSVLEYSGTQLFMLSSSKTRGEKQFRPIDANMVMSSQLAIVFEARTPSFCSDQITIYNVKLDLGKLPFVLLSLNLVLILWI